MCLRPIQIVNPSKYISLKYRDRFLLSVPCGTCAECQQTLSNQWFLRAWAECTDHLNDGAFLYFDTLTYDDEHLPHMSEIVPDLGITSCFRPKDIRLFIERLRINLQRKYNTTFRYFLSSEYGSEKYTARPHYHILLWIKRGVTPLQLSSLVSSCWTAGRTDGIPFKTSSYVLQHNVVPSNGKPENFLRACRYVTKYVQKSCLFQEKLNSRVDIAMDIISKKMPDHWLESIHANRVRQTLKRRVNQFHRQSKHFGESLLECLDIKELFNKGCVFMPSPKGIRVPVPLSTYYKRKLFYDLCEIDGTKVWQLNELGIQYRDYRRQKLVDDLADTFKGVSCTYNLGFSDAELIDLADYVINTQGRIKAIRESVNLSEKLPSVSLFNYITPSDREHLDKCGISLSFLGNNSIGYNVHTMPSNYITLNEFIAKHVYLDREKEKSYHLYIMRWRL